MSVPAFQLARVPEIHFGEGARAKIPELAASYGRRLLLVTGARSLRASKHGVPITDALAARKLAWVTLAVEDEPTPDLVDAAVREHHGSALDAVVGIGGGSVLDAAKAVAGLLPSGSSVMDHLEDVGRGVPYEGPSLPLILVPTTAGTGSEATKNAVLSRRGPAGFKKSFRHDALVARHAVVDPDLLATCPPELIAADGMDALTQLLESYVSLRASPVTDALAEAGLAAVREGLLPWHAGRGDLRRARGQMALAALLSGITLANAGLGAVHGLAAPLGATTEAPHGAVCGTLLAAVASANVAALAERDPEGPALRRYGAAHAILSGDAGAVRGADKLVRLLEDWTERLKLPRLGRWGVTESGLGVVVAGCRGGSMKTNPVVLTDAEVEAVLRARL